MADGSSSGVLSRLRDAVTGQSSDDEQTRDDAQQVTPDGAQSSKDTEQGQAAAEQTRDTSEQQQRDTETTGTESASAGDPSQPRVEEYADIMEQCADGDLTKRMEVAGDDGEMDRIALEFNDLVDDMAKTTGQLKSYVDEVESAGVGVERSADTVRRASEDVVDAMQNVSADAQAQREELETISEAIDDVAATLEQFAANHPDADIEPQVATLDQKADEIRDVASDSSDIQTETTIVSAAAEEQAAELSDISGRAADLQRYSNPLRAILDRFDTDQEDGSVAPSESSAGD